jgi:hypothetical protein
LYTPGNHEYYGEVVQKVDQYLQELADEIPNFHFMNPGHVVIDDVVFIGATLWTDLKGGDPLIKQIAQYSMNDYRRIKYRRSPDATYAITPTVTCEINAQHRKYLAETVTSFAIRSHKPWKIVVFTHHPPLEECAKNKFYQADDPLTFAYCNTGLEPLIEMCDYWLHGHIHNWSHVEFNGCQIIARPRGYNGHQIEAKHYDLTNKDAEIITI